MSGIRGGKCCSGDSGELTESEFIQNLGGTMPLITYFFAFASLMILEIKADSTQSVSAMNFTVCRSWFYYNLGNFMTKD